ncbi:protein ImuB [Aureimonas jatrophae]|uniref:DNA-directed DNA polymerase n=1 Tax=Aureimonas jatrophae TaxID=1166073 RepID=A0A1H0DKJ0_9HYPH|nr:protein ImuB [Aureimonas jatrophae]
MLVEREGNRRIVRAADRLAEAAGLRVGLPAAKAQAMVPGLAVLETDARGDAEALERLALWALRFSPVVAADPPDGLVMEITGTEHLHGDEEALLRCLVDRLHASGLEARAAVADTWGAAHAAARHSGARLAIVAPGETRQGIEPLPVEALRLDPAHLPELRHLGLVRIGDLLRQPRAGLARRFGSPTLRRLDQALGSVPEPIEPVRESAPVEVRRVFAEPISARETIDRHLAILMGRLCADMEARRLGARRLDLLFGRVDNTRQVLRVGTGRPVRDPAHLLRLLAERLGTVDPGFGIETMRLAATGTEPLAERQIATDLGEEAPGTVDLSALVDILATRVGERRVYRFAPAQSDVPERSVRRVEALAPDDGASWHDRWPRPGRLLPRPRPIQTLALLPDHPPASFTLAGTRHRVTRADGPERVFGEWWRTERETALSRDYFRVETEGGERYWIFRAGDGERTETGSGAWFLHGVFG